MVGKYVTHSVLNTSKGKQKFQLQCKIPIVHWLKHWKVAQLGGGIMSASIFAVGCHCSLQVHMGFLFFYSGMSSGCLSVYNVVYLHLKWD